MKRRIGVALALAASAGGLAACQTSRVAEHWGEAQLTNVARMAQNPEAELAPSSPVEGLDPLTGEGVIGKYGRRQAEERGPERYPSIIQVSTGSGS